MTTLGEVFALQKDEWQSRINTIDKTVDSYQRLNSGIAVFILPMPFIPVVSIIISSKIDPILSTIGMTAPWLALLAGVWGMSNVEKSIVLAQQDQEAYRTKIVDCDSAIAEYDAIAIDNPECANKIDQAVAVMAKNDSNGKVYYVGVEGILENFLLVVSTGTVCSGQFWESSES
jgi:hypothetical protein